MIPVLYEQTERDFSHNGIGFLSDAVKATVTEERNGAFELSLQYPIAGIWFEQIKTGSIVKAKANETSEPQLFRVYKISKPLQGVVTYSAEHISYDLTGVFTLGVNSDETTAEEAMSKAVSGAVPECSYTVYSDIAEKRPLATEIPASVRAVFGTIRDTFGGEFEFDNFSVKLHKARGSDNGVTIAYGKNLTDLKQESNISECYTHILPYAAYQREPEEYDENAEPETVYVYLPEKILPIPGAEAFGRKKIYSLDLSDRFEEGAAYTEAELRELAEDFLTDTDIGAPKVSLSVSFVQLWQTEEYKNIAPLERVRLCDIVTVKFPRLGVESKSKVVKTVFDTLSEHYESIDLGDVKETLADAVIGTEKALKIIKSSAERTESHIKRTDDRITLEVLRITEEQTELHSRIDLTAEAITSEVSRAAGEESRLSSLITQTAESISAEVTRATTAEGELSGRIELTAESLTAEIKRASEKEGELSSRITQTAESITTEVTRAVNAAEAELSETLSSKITQTVDSIRLSVSSKSANEETESTISITRGSTTISSVKISGTTAEQAAKISADAVKGITLTVANSSTGASSTLTLKSGTTTLSSGTIEFKGLVTFSNLTDGKTQISGDNITTGKISADRIDVSSLYVDRVYSGTTSSRQVVLQANGTSSLIVGGNGSTTTGNVSTTNILASSGVVIGRYVNGYGNSQYNLYFDVNSRTVSPNSTSSSYAWDLGTSTKPFGSLYVTIANLAVGNSGKLGFFGATPQYKKTGVSTLNSLIDALKSYGLIG